jgi:glycosyltransferase involved in cell wall biosynthesis
MARVLSSEGILAGFYVPMNTHRLDTAIGRFASPDGRVRRFLGRWNHGDQAHSSAVVPEVLTAGTFRLLATFGDARLASRLAGWRAEQIDRGIARRLSTQRPTTVLALQGFNRRTQRAARRLGIGTWLNVNADCWSVGEVVRNLAAQRRTAAELRDLDAEDWGRDIPSVEQQIREAEWIFTESHRIAARVRDIAPPGTPVVPLGQGVDARFFTPGPPQDAGERFRVLQVSRVGYAKGVEVADTAAKLAAPWIERFDVAGWNVYSSGTLRRNSTSLRFLGGFPAAGVRDLLQQADVFVLPTLADSMPRAVLEAMAAGLPVVTTDRSGYQDLIEDGVNGFLVPAGDAHAIAARLRLLAEDRDLRQRIGRAARVTAELNTWERYEERFRVALHEFLARPAGKETIAG